jgi:hypothetical protein
VNYHIEQCGSLLTVIKHLIPVLKNKGYRTQANRLDSSVNTYSKKMSALFGSREEEPEKKKPKNDDHSGQINQATKIVMDTIKGLPDNIQHSVRTEVARRGNTPTALNQVLSDRGTKL